MDTGSSAAPATAKRRIDWTGLFGYDVFLSYRREEASGFAAALAQDLARRDFTCFLDRTDAPYGVSLQPHLTRALKLSKALIVIVTNAAPNSPWVTMEVEEFLKRRKRQIIPVEVNRRYQSLPEDDTPWGQLRKRNLIAAAAKTEEVAAGRPDPALADTITEAFRYVRANVRRRIVTSLVAAVLIATALFAGWKAVQATRSASEADRQRRSAEKSLYVARMSLAQQNWEVQNIGSIGGVLEASRPGEGSSDLRGWEWYYVFGLIHTSKITWERIGGQVASVVWSPDGQLVAATTSATLSIWNVADQHLVRRIPADGGTYAALEWSVDSQSLAALGKEQALVWGRPDDSIRRWRISGAATSPHWKGNRLLFGILDGSMVQWDASGGAMTVVKKLGKPHLAVWSSDGRVAVAFHGSYDTADRHSDYPPQVWIVDSAGRELNRQDLESDPPDDAEVTAMAWKPHSDILAIATADNRIELWDVRHQSKPANQKLVGHDRAIRSVAWSRDGLLASASEDQTVRIWDPLLRKEQRTLRGHQGPVRSVCWSSDGNLLASGGYDQSVRIWTAKTPDGPRPFLTIDDFAAASDQLDSKNLQVNSIDWAPDSRRVVAIGQGYVDGASIESTMIFGLSGSTDVVVDASHEAEVIWRPDGRRFISPDGSSSIDVRDADSGRAAVQLPANHGFFSTAAWSPDGKRIATAGGGQTVRIWDDASGSQIAAWPSDAPSITELLWTQDGCYLSARSKRPTGIEVWDTIRGVKIQNLHNPGWNLSSLSWSPSGRCFALAAPDGWVEAWDAVKGRQLAARGNSREKHVTRRMFWASILHGHGNPQETGATGRSVGRQ